VTTKHLHVLGLCLPGWCWLTVPRTSIFAETEPEITEWDYGRVPGATIDTLPAAAIWLARKAREIQGLDYRTGPAIVSEKHDTPINSMLELLAYEKRLGDATLHFQLTAKPEDDVLRRLGMYVDDLDIRAATRQALTLLRRAREDTGFAHERWPYPPNGLALS